jgi:hypothetical protein
VYGLILATGMAPDALDEWLDAPTDDEQAALDAFADELGVSRG